MEEVLKDVLGSEWEQYKEVGSKILAYVDSHPSWNKIPYTDKNAIIKSLNESLQEIYGHDINYYKSNSRTYPFVSVRTKIVGVLRSLKIFSLNECGEIINRKNHSSIIYLERQNANYCSVDEYWRKEFVELKNKVISKL